MVAIVKNKAEKIPNKKQQECIDSIKGQYLVLAGPGSGKTYTVTKRIKNMIEQGIDPSKILCLTFSDAASAEMKSRVIKELNVADISVDIFTFHSFCNDLIAEFPLDFNLAADIKIITQPQYNQLLKECIEEINPIEYRNSKNDPYKMIKPIKDGIDEIQRYRLNKEKYFKNLETNPDYKPQIAILEEEIEKNKGDEKKYKKALSSLEQLNKTIDKAVELFKFYELYQEKKEKNRLIDFADMIDFVIEKFETSPSFLNKIANKYEYIMVDEYQDTNTAQNKIIFSLVDNMTEKNVFVVGDDDQTIYTFQGAKLDTIEKFIKHYPEVKIICLEENMRSTQNILDAARYVVVQDFSRLEANPEFKKYNISKELISKNPSLIDKNTPVILNKYLNQEQEYDDIVSQIEEIINSSSCPINENGKKNLSQIAILTKGNAQLKVFANKLKDKNIPFDLKEGKSVFEIKSSIALIMYLEVVANCEKYSNNLLKLFLMEPFKINPLDYMKIVSKMCDSKNIIEIIKDMTDFVDNKKMEDFIKLFNYLQNYQTNETLRNIVVEIGAKSGLFDYFLNNEIDRIENIQGIKKIIQEAIDFSDKYQLVDFVDYLNMCKDEDIEIKTDKPDIENNAIQLSTYHSSKGKEFEYVFMPTMLKNNWEKDNSSFKPKVPVDFEDYKTKDEIEKIKFSDRVKLMYVGMTRAKHKLILSYFIQKFGRVNNPLKTGLLENYKGLVENDKSNFDIEDYISNTISTLNKKNYDYKRDFEDLINEFLKEKTFSPTAINCYLNCPKQYLYDNILNLSSKYGNMDSLLFGTTIHNVLDRFFKNAKKNNKYQTLIETLADFENEIQKYSFSSYEQKNIHKDRGRKTLQDFYPILTNAAIADVVDCEYNLRFKTDDYEFFGKIDRVDKNSDGTYTLIDYKTGSAKTLSSIKPNGAKEDYYNQIALYKYFYEKATNSKVKEVCFVFPEEPTKNLYLTLDDEEIQLVKEKFDNAIKSIKNHEFEENKNEKSCKYCQYKDFCNMEII